MNRLRYGTPLVGSSAVTSTVMVFYGAWKHVDTQRRQC